ncbi:MAG: antibiotic biosynthesis monooxygenase [Flavobacteriia bacterium]|nr:antibiotic biosynthesis monooxygenase [Flavobacteriia bacterium]
MITRVVKINFKEDKINDFLQHFETIKWMVASQENCHGMKLYQDKNQENIVFTYSIWSDENALENYRKSIFFNDLWSTIKPWFKEKAEAWTLNEHFNGFNNK